MGDLRYPVGKFQLEGDITPAQREEWIAQATAAPAALRAAIGSLNDAQLDTPYRPGGWTVRQVVHHLPDSHANMYTRFRLALTEDVPTIKPYMEERWAELPDARTAGPEMSLQLLEGLHQRWVVLMRSFGPAEWKRAFRHPDLGLMPLDRTLGLYAWHGRHHVAHITCLRERMGWA